MTDKVYVIGSIEPSPLPRVEHRGNALLLSVVGKSKVIVFKVAAWDPNKHPKGYKGLFIETPDKIDATDAKVGDVLATSNGKVFKVEKQTEKGVKVNPVDADSGEVKESYTVLANSVSVAVVESGPSANTDHLITDLPPGTFIKHPKSGKRFEIGKHGNWTTVYPVDNNGVRQGKHTVLPPTSMVYVVPKSVSDSITQEQVDTVAAVAADLVPSTDAEPIGDKALEELLVSSWGDASNKVAEDLGIADSSAVKEAMAAYNIYNDTYFGELLGNPSLVTPPDYASQDSDKIISTLFDNLYVDGHDTEPLNLMKSRLAEVFGERFAKQQALAATPSIPDQLDEVLPSKLPKVPKKYQDGVGKDTKIVIEIGNATFIEKGQYGSGEVFVVKRVSPDGSSSVLGVSSGIGKAKKLARTMSADHEQIDVVTHINRNYSTATLYSLTPHLGWEDVKTGDVVVTPNGTLVKIGEIVPPDPDSSSYSEKDGKIELEHSNGTTTMGRAKSYGFLDLTAEEKTLAQELWDSTAIEASASGTPLDQMGRATFAGEVLRTALARGGRVETETEVLRAKRENKWIPELQHGWSSDELLGSDWQTDAHPRLRALGWREIKPRQKDFVRYTNKYGQRLIISRDKSGKVTNISEEKLKFAMVQNTTTAKELHANLTEAIAQGADITDLDPRNNEHSVLRNDAAQQLVYDTALGRVNGVQDAVALGDQIVKTDAEYESELTGIDQTIIEKPSKAEISAAPVGSEFEISGPMGPTEVSTYVKRDDYKVGDVITENGLARSAPVGTEIQRGLYLWVKDTDLTWRRPEDDISVTVNEFSRYLTDGLHTTGIPFNDSTLVDYEGDGLGVMWRLDNSHADDDQPIGDPIVDDATLAGMTGKVPDDLVKAVGYLPDGTSVDFTNQKLTVNKKIKAKIGTVDDYLSASGNKGVVQLDFGYNNPYPKITDSPKSTSPDDPGTYYTETEPLTDIEGAVLYGLVRDPSFLDALSADGIEIHPGDPTRTAKEVASNYDNYLASHVRMEISPISTASERKRAKELIKAAPVGARYVLDGNATTKEEDGSWSGIDFTAVGEFASETVIAAEMVDASSGLGATIEWNWDLDSGADGEAESSAYIIGAIGGQMEPKWKDAKEKTTRLVRNAAEAFRTSDIESQTKELREKEGTVEFKGTPFDLPLWDDLVFEAQSIDEIQQLAENLPPLGAFDAITDVPAFHSGGIVRDGLVLHQGGIVEEALAITAPIPDRVERRTRAKVLLEFDDDMTVKMIELGAENMSNPTPIKPGQGGSYHLHAGKAFVLYEGEKRIEYVAHDSAFSGKAPTSQRGRLSLFGYTPKEATERLQELGVVGPLQPEVPMTSLMRGKRRVGNYVPLLPEYVRGEAELPKSPKRLTHGVTGGDKQAVVDSVLEVGALLSIEQRYHARFLDKIHTSSPSGDIRSGLDHAVFVGLGTHSACGSGSSLRFILKPSAFLVRDITLTDHDFGSAETRYGKYKKYLNGLQDWVGEGKTSLYEPVSPAVRQRFLDNKPGGSAEYNLGPSVPLEDVEYVAVEPEYVEATQAKLDQMYEQGLLAEVPKVVPLNEYADLANRSI